MRVLFEMLESRKERNYVRQSEKQRRIREESVMLVATTLEF